MKPTLFMALAGLLLATAAQADDCRLQLPGWIEQAHPGQAQGRALEDERGRYRVAAEQSICKVWPARPHLTLVALLLVREEEDDHGDVDLEVLVLDSVRQTFVARMVEPQRLDWDVVQVDSMIFDTALYRLRGDDLAFGVRISRSADSSAKASRETRLALYELDGERVRLLLSELPVATFWGEWDAQCAGMFSDSTRVLIVTERVGNNGYRDLLFKQTRVESRKAQVAGECKTVEQSTHRAEFPIEYDEDRYLLPIEFVSEPGVP
ncbi:hypothetical protein VUJ49_23205 [Pseudomonas berkeleyensis]|uniref:DUF1176 domain-containing protein n=1 Tax=Pseudomonas berkeleyensis TaxID=2726956 RepID=A0A7G5DM97_9PSED|nr:hypothetical protein [Pseudomonas berkeleyensis]QMV62872.1 hypothetical protein HS968_23110 [Pseudomonas berkeleyensis]WSO38326.1 hypothetical protein VUJ49_23205 [Pseudomonas berkeleyensis]